MGTIEGRRNFFRSSLGFAYNASMSRDENALLYHSLGRPGKIEVASTKPVASQLDLSLAYSPGVDADVLIGLSAGNLVTQDMLKTMANKPIIFAFGKPRPGGALRRGQSRPRSWMLSRRCAVPAPPSA